MRVTNGVKDNMKLINFEAPEEAKKDFDDRLRLKGHTKSKVLRRCVELYNKGLLDNILFSEQKKAGKNEKE